MDISSTLLICIALAAATFVAYEGVRSNDFVHFDDDKYITSNEYVQKVQLRVNQVGVYDLLPGQLASADVGKSSY